MTPNQRQMARHALGLEDGRKRSYRNRYYCTPGTTQHFQWSQLVHDGAALMSESGKCFGLTLAGAKSVLQDGESLDAEDFPLTSAYRKDSE